MFSILTLVPFIALAFQASSLSPPNILVGRHNAPPTPPGTPDIPPECHPVCDPFFQTIFACTTAACACTEANGQASETCADCVIALDPGLTTTVQTILDQYTANCSAAGLPFTAPLTAVPSAPAPTMTA